MGKRKQIKTGAGDVVVKPAPLTTQIEKEKLVHQRDQPRGIIKKQKKDPEFVPNKTSVRILEMAAQQRQDIEEDEVKQESGYKNKNLQTMIINSEKKQQQFIGCDEEEEEEDNDRMETLSKTSWGNLLHDEEAVRTHHGSRSIQKRTRGDSATLAYAEDMDDKLDESITAGLSMNVIQMFKEIGDYMSHYKSGKIPKAFKSIPTLLNWEQILEITCPEKYSAASMLHATRLFSATASPKICEKFYRYYLLPRVMDDIMEFHKLNVHLFNALKRAVYKPTAFVKGILLPICQSDSFTMTVAHVTRAVLTSVSLPVFHAATAMIKISQLSVSSPVSYVLAGLIKKRYTLPSLAIDALLGYFHSFEDEQMPLSLNSCILMFVEFYRLEITNEQKTKLIELLMIKGHKLAREPILKQLQETTNVDVLKINENDVVMEQYDE